MFLWGLLISLLPLIILKAFFKIKSLFISSHLSFSTFFFVELFLKVVLTYCDLSVCRFDKEESAAGAETSDRKTLGVYKTFHLGGSADRYLWDQRSSWVSPGIASKKEKERKEEREHQVWGLSVGVSVGGDLKWLGFRLPAAVKGKTKIFFQRLQYENSPKINDKLGHDEVKEKKSWPEAFFLLFFSVFGSPASYVVCQRQRGSGSAEHLAPDKELCLSKVAPNATLNKSQRFISRQLPLGEERRRKGSETLLDGAKAGSISHWIVVPAASFSRLKT